jgi:hypothetical protein
VRAVSSEPVLQAVNRGRLRLALAALIALWPGTGGTHEERLLVGRVDAIDAARKLLVVTGVQDGERRRLEVNPETEVIVCRTAAGLAVISAGGLVRVKYLDRPGSTPEVQSILVLGGDR